MSQILYLTVVSSFPTPDLISVCYDNSTDTLIYIHKGKILNEKTNSLILHHTESNRRREVSFDSNITKILPSHRFKKYEHIPDDMPIYYQVQEVLSDKVIVYKKTADEKELFTIFKEPLDNCCVHPVTGDFATHYSGNVKIYQSVDYWANSSRVLEFKLKKDITCFGFELLPNGEANINRILLFSREKLNYFEGEELVQEIPIPFTDKCQVAMDTNMGILFIADSHKLIALDLNNKFETLLEMDIKFYQVKGLAVDMKRKQLFIGSYNFIHLFNYGYFDKQTVDSSLQDLLQQFSSEYMLKNKGAIFENSVKSYFRKMYNESNMLGVAPSRPYGYNGGGYCAIIPQLIPYVNQQPQQPNNQQVVVGTIQQHPQPVMVATVQEQPRSTNRSQTQNNQQVLDCCVIL